MSLLSTAITITCIFWSDAKGEQGWQRAEDYNASDVNVLSCGILVKEDEKTLTIALDKDQEGYYNSIGSVPKCIIAGRKDFQLELSAKPAGDSEKKP